MIFLVPSGLNFAISKCMDSNLFEASPSLITLGLGQNLEGHPSNFERVSI